MLVCSWNIWLCSVSLCFQISMPRKRLLLLLAAGRVHHSPENKDSEHHLNNVSSLSPSAQTPCHVRRLRETEGHEERGLLLRLPAQLHHQRRKPPPDCSCISWSWRWRIRSGCWRSWDPRGRRRRRFWGRGDQV